MRCLRWKETCSLSMLVAVLACFALGVADSAKGAAESKPRDDSSAGEPSTSKEPTGWHRTPAQRGQHIEHLDGNDLWKKWGIAPHVLTPEELGKRQTIVSALESRDVLRELGGERKMDKARPILEILGVDSLPNQPKRAPVRLSDEALRSIAGFVPFGLDGRPRDLNPDRMGYTHVETKERVRVLITYAEFPAQALRRFVEASPFQFSAPLALVLPTCRIKNGPGDFCWLGCNRSNEQHTLYFPLESDILFLRNGTAIWLSAEDVAKHDSVMDLARKIDALLLKQEKARNAAPSKQPAPEKSDRNRKEQERMDAQATDHPDGQDVWKKWGIPPRAMTLEERRRDGSIIEQLEPRRSKELLLELAGEKKIDKARPILDILGVDSLPSQPKRPAARLSDRSLRSVEGFVPASAVEDRPRGQNPDWVVYRHLNREGRVRVVLYYDDSPARAFCRLISKPISSAPLTLVLPTCRIMNGPGQFCWIGWSRTNNDRTLSYPSDADVLFLRDGIAVLVKAEDMGGRASAMELARKIDGLLVKQGLGKNKSARGEP